MEFDMCFIKGYLNRMHEVPAYRLGYNTNLRRDLNLNNKEVIEFLQYLESVFEVRFPKKWENQRYEYLSGIALFVIIRQFENRVYTYHY